MSEQNQRVFLSYAWGGESERIVNELDADLQARGITLVRDKRDLGYKGRISEFMQEIGRGHAVVVVISDKYLKSDKCMYELVEIAGNKDVFERIFPVVLADADIYKPRNRLKYVEFWEAECKAFDDELGKVKQVKLNGIRDERDSYEDFRNQISGLASLLSDMNTLTPAALEDSNFAVLGAEIEKRLRAITPTLASSVVAAVASQIAAAAPPPAVAPPATAAAADAGAYLAGLTQRLGAAGYEAMRGERFGEMRFKPAFNKIDKGFIANDHHRVLVLDEAALSTARLAEIQGELQNYVSEFVDREICNLFLICVVTTGSVPADVKHQLFATPPPSQDLVDDGKMVMVAVYSAADDDLLYPKAIPQGLDADFEVKIKEFLTP